MTSTARHNQIVQKQFGEQASAYLSSAVHAQGAEFALLQAELAVARVQARLDPWCGWRLFAGSLGLVACGFGSAWGCHVQFIPQKQSRASP